MKLGKPFKILLKSFSRKMIVTWARMVARNDSAEEKAGNAGNRK